MDPILKLRQEIRQRLDEQAEILTKAEGEERDLTEDEEKRYDELTAEVEDRDRRVKRLEKLAEQRAKLEAAQNDQTEPPARRQWSEPPRAANQQRPRYSLLRAIRCLMRQQPVDGLEGEISAELTRRYGRQPTGFFMPHDFVDPYEENEARQIALRARPGSLERRDLTTTTGTGAVGTDLLGGAFIELLRNRMLVQRIGATVMTGLQGDVAIPKATAAATAYWIDNESGGVTESNQTIGQVALSPTTVGAYTELTRKFVLQSSIDAELFVRNDLARVVGLAIDLAALNGSGSSNQPEGILQDSNIPTVAIDTDGGAPTWAKIVELETEITQDNADIGSMAYLFNAKTVGKLKTVEKASNTGQFIWETQGVAEAAPGVWRSPVNGYACGITNQLPSNLTKGGGSNLSAAIFGVWEHLLIGMWSGLDVIVNPYAGDTQGLLRVTMLQDCDIDFRHDEAFAKCVDISTA